MGSWDELPRTLGTLGATLRRVWDETAARNVRSIAFAGQVTPPARFDLTSVSFASRWAVVQSGTERSLFFVRPHPSLVSFEGRVVLRARARPASGTREDWTVNVPPPPLPWVGRLRFPRFVWGAPTPEELTFYSWSMGRVDDTVLLRLDGNILAVIDSTDDDPFYVLTRPEGYPRQWFPDGGEHEAGVLWALLRAVAGAARGAMADEDGPFLPGEPLVLATIEPVIQGLPAVRRGLAFTHGGDETYWATALPFLDQQLDLEGYEGQVTMRLANDGRPTEAYDHRAQLVRLTLRVRQAQAALAVDASYAVPDFLVRGPVLDRLWAALCAPPALEELCAELRATPLGASLHEQDLLTPARARELLDSCDLRIALRIARDEADADTFSDTDLFVCQGRWADREVRLIVEGRVNVDASADGAERIVAGQAVRRMSIRWFRASPFNDEDRINDELRSVFRKLTVLFWRWTHLLSPR